MSSSWTERQGQVGDLRHKSKQELCELLSRQEKLLANRRFLQSLQDKGKKITDFAERIRQAIIYHEEEEKKRHMLLSDTTKLPSYHQQASDSACGVVLETDTSPVSPNVQETTVTVGGQEHFGSKMAADDTMETGTAGGASQSSCRAEEGDLVKAMERVRLSAHARTELGTPSKDTANSTAAGNVFMEEQHQKCPHYIEVLERTGSALAPRKQKFKSNQPNPRKDASPCRTGSPRGSPQSSALLSAQDRKEQDRKHLDDVTAARLPPLHHSPAQLLSLEESAVLLREQTKKGLELQAKLAAQKLCEGLSISMEHYSPDGGAVAAYREVRDDGAQLSSEED